MSIEVSPVRFDENERIAALLRLHILDSEPEEDFNDIAALASQICNTPVAIIAFIGQSRVWFKAKAGASITEVSGNESFFTHNSAHNSLLVIPDTRLDERFATNPFMIEGADVRFYAATPITFGDGGVVGYLCVMDIQPGYLTNEQSTGLRTLGKQVSNLLQLRLHGDISSTSLNAVKNSKVSVDSFFRNAVDAVIVADEEGLIVEWNEKANSIFGWQENEVIGKDLAQVIIPQKFNHFYKQELKRCKDNAHGSLNNRIIEIAAVNKAGEEFNITISVSPTKIGEKEYCLILASQVDAHEVVTEQLGRQREFYENILNKLPTDIVVFDANHKYLFVNPGAIKNDELRKYIIGKDDFEYAKYRNRDTAIAEKRRQQFLEIKRNAKEIRWEDSLKDPDGNTITHLRRLFPVYDDDGELSMVIGFGIDITDRKLLEEKQSELVKQLSSQNTQLVDFCNIVSHNLRAPLVNMSLLTKFISSSDDVEEQQMLIAKLSPVIDNLHTTFNELVESIQIKNDAEIQSEKIELTDCMQRTIAGLNMEITKSGAVIETDFDDAPVIKYPSKYLFSIFHNLVSNSLKYQSPNRKPHIMLKTRRDNDKIILSVQDNGLGMDLVKHKDNLFKIGKVFHRHPNSKGFGLFMTKTQVEAMGGTMWAESTPDKGSTFFVEFINQNA